MSIFAPRVPGITKPAAARCEPPPAFLAGEFHWLLFGVALTSWRSAEMWRWRNGAWHCVRTPGADFTPEEMHAQGWRYAEPCVAPVFRLVPKP